MTPENQSNNNRIIIIAIIAILVICMLIFICIAAFLLMRKSSSYYTQEPDMPSLTEDTEPVSTAPNMDQLDYTYTLEGHKLQAVEDVVAQMTAEEIASLNYFINNTDFVDDEERGLATLMYFYPFGFVQEDEAGIMRYYGSAIDANYAFPFGYTPFSYYLNKIVFVPIEQLEEYYLHRGEEGERPYGQFELYIFQDCWERSSEEVIEAFVTGDVRSTYDKVVGPSSEEVFAGYDATYYKYVSKPTRPDPYSETAMTIEDHFINVDNETYNIYLKYNELNTDRVELVKKSLDTLELGGNVCKEQVFKNVPDSSLTSSSASRYNLSRGKVGIPFSY